jgi:phage terminase small subunit
MNIRLQKYKKNRLSGMNQYNAALAAGYSKSYARHHNDLIEDSADIKDVLDRAGLTDTYLAKKHLQLIEAKKVIGYLHQYKKATNGDIEKVEPDEVISNEFLDVDDSGIQLKALELAYKLKEKLKDKVEHSGELKVTEMKSVTIGNRLMELNIGN